MYTSCTTCVLTQINVGPLSVSQPGPFALRYCHYYCVIANNRVKVRPHKQKGKKHSYFTKTSTLHQFFLNQIRIPCRRKQLQLLLAPLAPPLPRMPAPCRSAGAGPARLGHGCPHAAAPQRRTLGYTLRELLSLLAHGGHSWPLEWPAGRASANPRMAGSASSGCSRTRTSRRRSAASSICRPTRS